ncbi:hypothetical protein ACHAO8_001652 [Botrytis cinerea]
MKFSYAAIILGTASIVSAQSAACTAAVAAVPACGASCIDTATSKYCSGADDYACECSSDTFSEIENEATDCVVAACGVNVAIEVLDAVSKVCTTCV